MSSELRLERDCWGARPTIDAVFEGIMNTKLHWRLLALLFVFPCGSALAQQSTDQAATFFMGRATYHKDPGTCCGDVGQAMTKLMARVTTIPVKGQRKVAMSSTTRGADIFETPFLFMNGHNDFVYSATELNNLRNYLERGGFLFASGCCTNPAFPSAWRREMARVFPGEKVQPLEYDHAVYRAFYHISEVRNLHENRLVRLEGLFFEDRLVAVMCENGLCCAFARDNACNRGRGVSPEDGRRLAINIAVYAMTH
jgi:hypothetical protein